MFIRSGTSLCRRAVKPTNTVDRKTVLAGLEQDSAEGSVDGGMTGQCFYEATEEKTLNRPACAQEETQLCVGDLDTKMTR